MLGTLVIRPKRATIIHSTSFLSEMSPYLRIKYNGKQVRTHVANSQGKIPVWGDVFEFQQIGETSIQVEVWDKNSFTADQYIGETVISFPAVYQVFHFESPSIFYKKGKEKGTVFFEFDFRPIANLIVQPIYGAPQPSYNNQQFGIPPTGYGNLQPCGIPPTGYIGNGDISLQDQNAYQIPQHFGTTPPQANYYQVANQGNMYRKG